MASFDVKGVRIGEGRTKTVVSIMGASDRELLDQAANAVHAGADCIEWRADCFTNAKDPIKLVQMSDALAKSLSHTPLLFTIRTKPQGGHAELNRREYVQLVHAVIEAASADLVDIELFADKTAMDELLRAAHTQGVRTVVSYHDFGGTPAIDQMLDYLERMASLGADVAKLAVYAQSTHDCLRLMDATAYARERLEIPLLTIAMGQEGMLSRLCGQAVGSALTFCSVGEASAPGQVALNDAVRVLEGLDVALRGTVEQPLGS